MRTVGLDLKSENPQSCQIKLRYIFYSIVFDSILFYLLAFIPKNLSFHQRDDTEVALTAT